MHEDSHIRSDAEVPVSSRRWLLITLSATAVLIAYIVFLVVQWNYDSTRWITSEKTCSINLKVLGLALHNYHDEHGTFPPAYIADEDGKPMHSWRVLILPYLDQQKLYDEYDFTEPWDGPNNRKLMENVSSTFASGHSTFGCPGDDHHKSEKTLTNYVAVVGKQTAWRGERGVSISDITDGMEQTIHLVEIRNSDIKWMEPRDLVLDETNFALNSTAPNSPGSNHITSPEWFWQERVPFVYVSTVDGAAIRLQKTADERAMKALLTANGGEKADIHQLTLPYAHRDWRDIRLKALPTMLFILIVAVISLAAKSWLVFLMGFIGSLLGIAIPERGVHPSCASAEAYSRFFESWTFDHVVHWGTMGLLLGLVFGAIGYFIRTRHGERLLSSSRPW